MTIYKYHNPLFAKLIRRELNENWFMLREYLSHYRAEGDYIYEMIDDEEAADYKERFPGKSPLRLLLEDYGFNEHEECNRWFEQYEKLPIGPYREYHIR